MTTRLDDIREWNEIASANRDDVRYLLSLLDEARDALEKIATPVAHTDCYEYPSEYESFNIARACLAKLEGKTEGQENDNP